ncbi:hypothetical protein CO178_00690, partial [candidate division WWE3 bacterium CG_4_9_14_3_um_filter_34_6]
IISEVQITPIKPKDGLVGFASFVLNNPLSLSSIGIMTRPQGGYRLVYPTKPVGNKQMNIFYPINRNFASLIQLEIVKKFEEVMNHDRHDSFSS